MSSGTASHVQMFEAHHTKTLLWHPASLTMTAAAMTAAQ
jgi:hypothetical protein